MELSRRSFLQGAATTSAAIAAAGILGTKAYADEEEDAEEEPEEGEEEEEVEEVDLEDEEADEEDSFPSEDLIEWLSDDSVFRTASEFTDDEECKPSDEDLMKIMGAGVLAESGGGAQPWYFVAITGYDEQQEVAPGFTNHGTATILCCTTADALANIDTVASDGTTSQTLCNIFDLGDATGYMAVAAMSLGYQVHIEASVNRVDHDDETGQLSTDEICEKYIKGTYYYGGVAASMSDTAYEDAAEFCPYIVAGMHIGKVAEVDGVSSATSIERVQNYAIWTEDLEFDGEVEHYGVASVEMITEPTNLYAPDWSLDGLVILVTYEDGTSEEIEYDADEDTGDAATWSSTYGSASDALGHANQSAQYNMTIKYANYKIVITLNPGVTAD